MCVCSHSVCRARNLHPKISFSFAMSERDFSSLLRGTCNTFFFKFLLLLTGSVFTYSFSPLTSAECRFLYPPSRGLSLMATLHLVCLNYNECSLSSGMTSEKRPTADGLHSRRRTKKMQIQKNFHFTNKSTNGNVPYLIVNHRSAHR